MSDIASSETGETPKPANGLKCREMVARAKSHGAPLEARNNFWILHRSGAERSVREFEVSNEVKRCDISVSFELMSVFQVGGSWRASEAIFFQNEPLHRGHERMWRAVGCRS